MESINLIEDIQKTNVMEGGSKADVFTDNANGDSYSRYLELLDNYYKQSIKGTFTNDYEFFVDDDGNYVKNALDKKDEKNNMVVLKPKYINIKNSLEELNEIIKQQEYLLRQFRTELLNNNNSVKGDFDATLEEYNNLLAKRDSIIDYNNKTNKINENKEAVDKLKLDNINLNLEQYTTMNFIKLREANEEEEINKYLLNNEAINSNNEQITSLKSQPVKEFIVKEVFNNNTPVKKTIKFKKTKKTDKPKKDLVKDESKEKAAAAAAAAATATAAAAAAATATTATKEKEEESNDELEVDLSKKDKSEAKSKEKAKDEEKEDVPDPESNNELEEVDLGLKAEELDLGDDLEALQPIFDDGDEENEDYVFNKSGTTKGADEDKNIPLKLGSDSGDEDSYKEDKSKKESPTKETKVKEGTGKKEASASASGEEIDLDKLSKQLNKKVKDPKIKIIRIDPNLQFSNISSAKCDDSKTTRSDIETTNVAGGKKRKKKGIDPDLKNCMFPFKEGKGKKAVMHTECTDTGIENWCATERKEDCTPEKWAYCKSEKEKGEK
jgi:hypothetical protein